MLHFFFFFQIIDGEDPSTVDTIKSFGRRSDKLQKFFSILNMVLATDEYPSVYFRQADGLVKNKEQSKRDYSFYGRFMLLVHTNLNIVGQNT